MRVADPIGPAAAASIKALPALRLARYRYRAVFEHDLPLPAFAGPLLRSVFGLALRRGACVTGAPKCSDCALYRSCVYPALFETPPRDTQLGQRFSQVPNPYVIEPPPQGTLLVRAGQVFEWHQVLIGDDAVQQLPLVVYAWERALDAGWGERRVRGRLIDLACVDAVGASCAVRAAGTGGLLPHDATLALPRSPEPVQAVSHLHLDFHTPLRLQHEGRPLRSAELGPRKLTADLLRRCNLMLDLHLGLRPAPFDAPALVAQAAQLGDDRSTLQWRDDARYSARQRQETPLGGVLGRWTLTGDCAVLAQLWPWLWLGQWLHLGKNATMGMGGYTLEAGA
jgi:hypothetical protein